MQPGLLGDGACRSQPPGHREGAESGRGERGEQTGKKPHSDDRGDDNGGGDKDGCKGPGIRFIDNLLRIPSRVASEKTQHLETAQVLIHYFFLSQNLIMPWNI